MTLNRLLILLTRLCIYARFPELSSWAPSLPRHLFKEACQKRSLKKVSFEFGDPDEGDAKVIFMIGYKEEKGAKRKREAQEGQ